MIKTMRIVMLALGLLTAAAAFARGDEHITGVVLRSGANDAQKKAIVSTAKTLEIEAFEDDGGDLKPLAAPAAPPAPGG
jgi:hypothetical protein